MSKGKPSDRRRGGMSSDIGEPDLTPIMNLTFMLILALLTMASILPLGLITVQAPQLGASDGSGGPPPDKPDKPPLNLTIFVTMKGFNLAASGATLSGDTAEPPRPGETLFPKVQVEGKLDFDYAALNKKLIEVKKLFRREQSVIIVADPDVVYEDVVRAMDTARESEDGTELFPAVAFSPGIMG